MLRKLALQAAIVAIVSSPALTYAADKEEGSGTKAAPAATAAKEAEGKAVRKHPLDPLINSAQKRLKALESRVQDYTCRFVKQERIRGELRPHEIIDMKVRHEPFSVYMHFLKPKEIDGQIVSFIDGQNDGKMIVKPVGIQGVFGPVAILTDGALAMKDQRYPITRAGFVHLTEDLIKVGLMDRKYGECKVRTFKGAKVGERVCTVTEVIHPVRRKNFRFYRARIFVDDELDIPIRYAAWTWPEEMGAKGEKGKPVLEEEYTYTNLKLNPGLTDADFKVE